MEKHHCKINTTFFAQNLKSKSLQSLPFHLYYNMGVLGTRIRRILLKSVSWKCNFPVGFRSSKRVWCHSRDVTKLTKNIFVLFALIRVLWNGADFLRHLNSNIISRAKVYTMYTEYCIFLCTYLIYLCRSIIITDRYRTIRTPRNFAAVATE